MASEAGSVGSPRTSGGSLQRLIDLHIRAEERH